MGSGIHQGFEMEDKQRNSKIEVYDPTLRDGNHAVKHSLTLHNIKTYCEAVDGLGLAVVEVGHGNGLGASSLQLGLAAHSDEELLRCARENLKKTMLGVHVIPGFARIDDIRMAVDAGVDVVRVASHCTEADLCQRYIQFARKQDRVVHGVLMMSHMASAEKLAEQALLLQHYGANAVILMDSAGAYTDDDVERKVGGLVEALEIPVGFHAHNNLGLAVSNSIAAVKHGASIVDGTMAGFGAGAGNTPLEVLVALLSRLGYSTQVDLYRLLDAFQAVQSAMTLNRPTIKESNIVSGLYGVFSGFERPVAEASRRYGVDAREVYRELGRRNVVAGQEDLIVEVASRLSQTMCSQRGIGQ